MEQWQGIQASQLVLLMADMLTFPSMYVLDKIIEINFQKSVVLLLYFDN